MAVKMVCGREKEIAAFVPEEYWSLTARLEGKTPPPFQSKLVEVGGKKVRPRDAAETAILRAAVENGPFVVREVRKKLRRRQAPAPFTTSKLQQEASKALRMQAYRTMMVAQSLYEGVEIPGAGLVGLITYMRTDSVRVADEAMAAVRDHIGKQYGAAYLPETPNVFRNRKSAQDAHEAIRPTSLEYPPASLKGILSRDQLRLYELIWKRFVASQMATAEFEQTAVDILCDPAGAPAGGYLFRAGGSVPKFAGFLEVYEAAVPEGRGEGGNGETGEENGDAGSNGEKAEENVLPPLAEGEVLVLRELTGNQHFTQPTPRFSESSLIKELEEQGIGRPSTYASIVKTIRERGYVKVDEGKFLQEMSHNRMYVDLQSFVTPAEVLGLHLMRYSLTSSGCFLDASLRSHPTPFCTMSSLSPMSLSAMRKMSSSMSPLLAMGTRETAEARRLQRFSDFVQSRSLSTSLGSLRMVSDIMPVHRPSVFAQLLRVSTQQSNVSKCPGVRCLFILVRR